MIIGLPMVLFGRHGVFLMARIWAESTVWWLKIICGLCVEYRGLENIPQGGYILASKHQSALETFALLRHTPDFAIILKKQLLYVPFFGLYLAASKQIAIDRKRGQSALVQIIRKAGEVLRSGRQVYIYPEGTRRQPGAAPAYKFGVTALYVATNAPCLPVALNTGLFWGRNSIIRRPGTAVIEFLPVIAPGLTREAFASELQARIEAGCQRLNQEAIERDPALARELQQSFGTAP